MERVPPFPIALVWSTLWTQWVSHLVMCLQKLKTWRGSNCVQHLFAFSPSFLFHRIHPAFLRRTPHVHWFCCHLMSVRQCYDLFGRSFRKHRQCCLSRRCHCEFWLFLRSGTALTVLYLSLFHFVISSLFSCYPFDPSYLFIRPPIRASIFLSIQLLSWRLSMGVSMSITPWICFFNFW